MNDKRVEIDTIDRRILQSLQSDASLSQRAIADAVGLSQNACWRRMRRLEEAGVMRGQRAVLDHEKLGLDLTVVVLIKTPHHAKDWASRFKAHVARLPGVIDLYRIGGEWDYMIRVVTWGMAGYDEFYRRLVDGFELTTVTGHFVMERLIEDQPLQLG